MTGEQIPYDIAIVGLGMVGVHQITREVEETIKRSNRLFVSDLGVGMHDFLRTLCPDITDLASNRAPGEHRLPIYRAMASEVVSAALENPPVCFATYGNPRLYCYPTELITRAARVMDLRVRVLPGVSSIDVLLVDLGLDPAFDGLQIYESTDLVIRQRPIQPDAGCVVMQAPMVLDAYNRPTPPATTHVRTLQEYLLRFYPPSHQAVLLISAIHPLMDPIRLGVRLDELANALGRSSTISTLYIPPTNTRPVANTELAAMMAPPEVATVGPPPVQPRADRPPIGPQR